VLERFCGFLEEACFAEIVSMAVCVFVVVRRVLSRCFSMPGRRWWVVKEGIKLAAQGFSPARLKRGRRF
jgi:hypothetical protein